MVTKVRRSRRGGSVVSLLDYFVGYPGSNCWIWQMLLELHSGVMIAFEWALIV